MTGHESRYQENRSTKFNRTFQEQSITRFTNAMAITIGRWISGIGVVEPNFETVEARLRAAQGQIFFFDKHRYVYRATGGTGRDGRMASREFAHERSARVQVLSTCHYRLRSRVSERHE